jgi:hypothetical protein
MSAPSDTPRDVPRTDWQGEAQAGPTGAATGIDQIATARLMVLKGAVRLEAAGMKHSSGKSMRKLACRELGLPLSTGHDNVIGALCREIEKRLKKDKPCCPSCGFTDFMVPALARDAHTHHCTNCNVHSSPNGAKK